MRLTLVVTALAIVLLAACDDGVEVTKSEYGDNWPFKPDEGTVECLSDGSVIFVVDGIQYGLNGFAKSRGYRDLEPIWLHDMAFHEELAKGVAAAEQVTLDEAYKMLGPPQTRINIGPILDLGLSLC